MANNRMWLVCNVCVPSGAEWPAFDTGKMFHIAKWYPSAFVEEPMGPIPGVPFRRGNGAYYTNVTSEEASIDYVHRLDEFLANHEHLEFSDGQGHENPVRLEYETWIQDMPAIKKWEYKQFKAWHFLVGHK